MTDLVEVVRCKDCQYGYSPYADHNDQTLLCGWYQFHAPTCGVVPANHYCSFGERSEDD